MYLFIHLFFSLEFCLLLAALLDNCGQDFTRALPILVFADISDTDISYIFLANMSTDIADTDFLVEIWLRNIYTMIFCSFV